MDIVEFSLEGERGYINSLFMNMKVFVRVEGFGVWDKFRFFLEV